MKAETAFSRLTAALLLALGGLDLLLEVLALGVQVDLLGKVADSLGAHPAAEILPEAEGRAEAVLELAEERLVRDDVLDLHVLEEVPDVAHALRGVLDVGLGVRDVRVELLAQVALLLLLAVLVGELLDVDVEGVGPEVVVVGESGRNADLRYSSRRAP